MRKILLLGASGSIGSQSLDILKGDPKSFLLTSFSVGKRVEIIPDILLSFPSVSHICVQKESDYDV
jgi:1-deoxy-D-xylulose-5-phosphate reductoisomerase